MSENLEEMLDYCKQNDRICPLPTQWDRLYQLLPDKRRSGAGSEPPLPLILAAWNEPAMFKRLRLAEHVVWAESHGALDRVGKFLRNLSEDEWFHLGD